MGPAALTLCLAAIWLARKESGTADWHVLLWPATTFTDGIGEMLGAGFHEIKVWQKGAQPLDAYIQDNHIDVIVSLEPGQDSFFFKDPYWAIVQNNPDAAGFTRLPVPNQDAVRVYVRTDRIQKSGT